MNYDIHQALEDIHEWVQTLEESELSPACQEETRSFFQFLDRKGHDKNVFIAVVRDVTGHHPHDLHTIQDADELRHYIEAYPSAQFDLNHEEHRYGRSNNQWLEESIRWFFGR